MSHHVQLTIAQPCSESWDAMTPTANGRHCAACQKTVIDFTLKTDAEILAYLAQAAGSTCGQFRPEQLERPLVPIEALVPANSRWRTWLAAAVAVWSLREGTGFAAKAQAPAAQQAHHPKKKPMHNGVGSAPLIRGVVRDPATKEPLPGVAVFLKGENRRTTTDSAGRFRLRGAAKTPRLHYTLVLHRAGYQSRTVPVPGSGTRARAMTIELQADPSADGVEVVGYMPMERSRMISGGISSVMVMEVQPLKEAKARPHRSFFEWLTQPFHRNQTSH